MTTWGTVLFIALFATGVLMIFFGMMFLDDPYPDRSILWTLIPMFMVVGGIGLIVAIMAHNT